MWCAAKLPGEHGSLRVMSAPPNQHAEPQSTWTTGRMEEKLLTCSGYADDVTVFVTHPAKLKTILQVMQCFEKAKGTPISHSKSKAMDLGLWTAPATELGIAFHDVHYFENKFGDVITLLCKV